MAFIGDNGCGVWCNYNGTNNSIRDSHNVSSITDHGSGDQTINFSVTFSNNDFSVVTNQRLDTTGGAPNIIHTGNEHDDNNTDSCRIKCGTGNQNAAGGSGSAMDVESIHVAVFGAI